MILRVHDLDCLFSFFSSFLVFNVSQNQNQFQSSTLKSAVNSLSFGCFCMLITCGCSLCAVFFVLGRYISCCTGKVHISPSTCNLSGWLRRVHLSDPVACTLGKDVQLVYGVWNLLVRFSRFELGWGWNHELTRSCWKCYIQVCLNYPSAHA